MFYTNKVSYDKYDDHIHFQDTYIRYENSLNEAMRIDCCD
jgi:hypothetical protein